MSEGETSEGESDEGDLKDGELAIGGAPGVDSSGFKGKGIDRVDWGDVGDFSVQSERRVDFKIGRRSCPKSGGDDSAGVCVEVGRDSKDWWSLKTIINPRLKGGGESSAAKGDKGGNKQGLRSPESGISFQQSYPKQGSKEADGSIDYSRPGGDKEWGNAVSISLYVGNFPESFTHRHLKLLFMEYGKVTDVFISQKTSKFFNSRFAFVRFKSREEADCAILGMDGAEFEGLIMVVNEARFSRNGSVNQPKLQSLTHNIKCAGQGRVLSKSTGALSYAQAVLNNGVNAEVPTATKRKVCVPSGNEAWLSASILGTLRAGYDCCSVKSILCGTFEEITGISSLGGCRVLVSFSSIVSRNNALDDPVWHEWFFSMEPWKVDPRGGLYHLWITCVGIPVLAWNAESFALIGKQWGRLVDVDEESANRSQFVMARLLIESSLDAIDEYIDLVVDGYSYNVQVSSASQVGTREVQCRNTLYEWGNGAYVAKTGNSNSAVGKSDAEIEVPEHQFAAKDEMGLAGCISPVLFGCCDENIIRIFDEDAGCLTRIYGEEAKGRHVLNEGDIRGDTCGDTWGGVQSGRVAEEGFCKNVIQQNSGSGDGYSCSKSNVSLGVSSGHYQLIKEEANHEQKSESGVAGRESCKVSEERSVCMVADKGLEGEKISDEGGGPEKITLAVVKKFVASQEFINSSISLTTDVLVECKEHGIRISESDQRAIIEAMTKRHIQAEVDFYAESSSGGAVGEM